MLNEVRRQNAERRTQKAERRTVFNFQFYIFLFLGLSPAYVCAEDQKKVVIPFDFVSKFDDGRYGEMVGDMIWQKLNSAGGFILPESMSDVRDYCQSHHIRPSPDDSLDKIKKIVREDFQGHIGIWGSVERVAGKEGEVYDLVIKCVDFSAEPDAKVIYQTKSRTNSVSEIPHLYVKAMLDALYHRTGGGSAAADPEEEANWKNSPNLVPGGDFQTGTGGVPKGWEKVAGQKREPLGNLVKWVAEEGKPDNKIIRFTFDKAVGDNEGVMYYSDCFPIEEGAKYRFQCRWKTSGPKVKVFIKCYDEIATAYQKSSDKSAALEKSKRQGKDEYLPENIERREVYRSQQNPNGPKDTWNVHTEDFTPRHTQYAPKWGRVMLYAYLGAGVVEFDDVVVKQILPPLNGEKKELRPSLGTKVSTKEIEEKERLRRESNEMGK